MRTDLEELKRLLAEEGPRLKADLAQMRHTGLTLVNAIPDLIARVERAEKERRLLERVANILAAYSTIEGTELGICEEIRSALTGDTPNG